MSTFMQAIGFKQYGGPEVLESLLLEIPKISPNQVLIKVAASGVNPGDSIIRSGQLKYFVRVKFPFVPGSDVAGVITEVGSEVKAFQVGDFVYTMLPLVKGGGYAEYVAVSSENLALAPATLTLEQAAAIPVTALTALQALRDKAQVKPDQHILIIGGSGGVGSFAIQIAKALGARVTATSSSRNLPLLCNLGADEAIDYTRDDLSTKNNTYDVIFDAVGFQTFGQVRKFLRAKGVFVTVNFIRANLFKRFFATIGGSKRLKGVIVKPNRNDLELLGKWVESGEVTPVIEQTYPLSKGIEAQRYSETKRVRGKLVLIIDPELAISKPKSTVQHN